MQEIKINNTVVLLQDFEKPGQGKIIIADDYMGAFTYTWGAMGCSIAEFIKSINSGYFSGKLCRNTYVFSAKKSVSSVRRYIKDELKYELPWYKFMPAQKEMREELKKLESCNYADEFINSMSCFPEHLMCPDLNYSEEKEFKGLIDSVFTCEPWHFIVQDYSDEYKWLCDLHRALKKKITKQTC